MADRLEFAECSQQHWPLALVLSAHFAPVVGDFEVIHEDEAPRVGPAGAVSALRSVATGLCSRNGPIVWNVSMVTRHRGNLRFELCAGSATTA